MLENIDVNYQTKQLFVVQVDVLHHASDRISSSAELYGAVQQEARISRAIEIMLLHLENVKRIHDKEHAELEEARKLVFNWVSVSVTFRLGRVRLG